MRLQSMSNVKIGIDVGGTTLKLGVVQNGLDIIYRDTRPSPHDAEKMAAELYDMIITAQKQFPDAPSAISTAGTIDENGCLDANQLGFEKAPVGPLLFEKLGYKIPIENDGVCALVAEHAVGSLKGCHSCLMITLGTGVGGGVIVNDKPYRGWRNVHAELGHMITHVDGKKCSCGQTGCWEAYASASALSEMAGGMAPRDVIDRVRNGEMQDIFAAWVHEVAQGLIGLCSIFYPERIAIGGGLSNAGELVVGAIRDAVLSEEAYKNYYAPLQVVQAHFQNDAGILGAAALA